MSPDQLALLFGDMTIVQGVLIVLAVVALITLLVKAWPKIRAGVRLIDLLGDLPKRLESIDDKLAEVHHETHRNDGSSLKDAVGRIEVEQQRQADMLIAALTADDQITERLDNIEDTFTKETP